MGRRDFLLYRRNEMTDVVTPPAETAEKPIETIAQGEDKDLPVEQWDKERAARTIHTQREEAKLLKAQLKELDTLKAEKEQRTLAEMTEAQKLQKQAEDASKEVAALKADILRRDVIAETGLPAAFAERLKGSTKEELLEDAKQLKALLPTAQPAPHINATNPNGASVNETDAQMRERLFGRQGNPFDPANVKAKGGGVVWNQK
jgi:hypothetical protein